MASFCNKTGGISDRNEEISPVISTQNLDQVSLERTAEFTIAVITEVANFHVCRETL